MCPSHSFRKSVLVKCVAVGKECEPCFEKAPLCGVLVVY